MGDIVFKFKKKTRVHGCFGWLSFAREHAAYGRRMNPTDVLVISDDNFNELVLTHAQAEKLAARILEEIGEHRLLKTLQKRPRGVE